MGTKHLTIVAALVGALLGPRAAAQGTFAGMVTYKVTSPEGKTGVLRYYQLGARLRQEVEADGQNMATITDGTTGDMISLIPQRKQYFVMNLRQAAGALGAMGGGKQKEAPDFSKLKVTATGRRDTIAGIACEHFLFESTEAKDHPPMDICGATGMGFMGSGGQGASLMPSTAALLNATNPELARLARQGFFPLKLTMAEKQGGKQMVLEATAVDRHRPDAALFAPPPDYTKFTMPVLPSTKP